MRSVPCWKCNVSQLVKTHMCLYHGLLEIALVQSSMMLFFFSCIIMFSQQLLSLQFVGLCILEQLVQPSLKLCAKSCLISGSF